MTSTNIHQRHLDDTEVAEVLSASGVDPHRVAQREEIGAATYNTAYRVRLDDGTGLVLKIAPDPAAPSLTYERDLMRTETAFYRTAAAALPVPTVVHADASRRVIGADYLLMTELPGRSWHELGPGLTEADRRRLRGRIGEHVAQLHQVTGSGFGYPQRGLSTSWREAFGRMIGDLLDDAELWRTPLPVAPDQIRDLIDVNGEDLDEVTTPVLVHFDLWPGNILLHEGQISGFVDGERAFWGDPLAEMVSLALFGDIEQDIAFLEGYAGLSLDAGARRRLAMYQTYLYLIMLIEAGPRGYAGPAHEAVAVLVAAHLRDALGVLGWTS